MKKIFLSFLCVLFGLSATNAQFTEQKKYSVVEVLEIGKTLNPVNKNYVLLQNEQNFFSLKIPLKVLMFPGQDGKIITLYLFVEFNVAVQTGHTKCGLENGETEVFIEGGQPPYVVLLDNQNLSAPWKKTGMKSGCHPVKVNDQMGNEYQLFCAQIDPSSAPVASLVATKENCGQKDATVNVTVNGGKSQGMFFNWKGPNGFTSSLKNLSGLGAGTYTVIVTDGDWCTDVKSIVVSCDNSVVKYSDNIINRKNCDSLKTLKLDTMPSGKSFLTGQDSFTIFNNVFAKTYYKNVQTHSCNPLDTGTFVSSIKYHGLNCDSLVETKHVVLDTKIIFGYAVRPTCDSSMIGQVRTNLEIFKTRSGCDSMRVDSFISGFAFKTITQVVCKPTAPYYLYIPRNGLCDSVVKVVSVMAPAPKTQTQSEFSCFARPATLDTLYSIQGCDSVYVVTNFVVRQKLDTTRLNIFVCGLKKPAHREFNLTNRFGCDSLVIIDSLTANSKITQLPLTRTCEKALSGNFDTLLYTQHGCDSLVKWSVAYVAPTRKVNTSFVCDKSQAGVFSKFFQNQYGCDSTVVDSVVYAGSKITILPTKEFCGTKNSDMVVDSLFTNFRGCDSMVQQRIIEKESPVITENGYTHPTNKWNGTASFVVNGGTVPYEWKWSNSTTANKASISGLKGGVYTAIVQDSKGCRDTADVRLSDFWASSTKPGIVTIHGGLADQILIDLYGSEYGELSLLDSNGKNLFSKTSKTMYMPDEFREEIPVQAKGVLIALMTLPNGYLLSKVSVQ